MAWEVIDNFNISWNIAKNGGKITHLPPFLAIFQEMLKLAITSQAKKFHFNDTFPLWKYHEFTAFSAKAKNPGSFGKYETEKNTHLWFFSWSSPY